MYAESVSYLNSLSHANLQNSSSKVMDLADKIIAERSKAALLKAAEIEQEQGIYPWYGIHDEHDDEGNFFLLRILIDSDEGREYEKIPGSNQKERLTYMREHAQNKYQVVQPDATFFEDTEGRRTYYISYKSPDYPGFHKLLREDATGWLLEDVEEWKIMTQYFRDHATKVVDIKKC